MAGATGKRERQAEATEEEGAEVGRKVAELGASGDASERAGSAWATLGPEEGLGGAVERGQKRGSTVAAVASIGGEVLPAVEPFAWFSVGEGFGARASQEVVPRGQSCKAVGTEQGG